MRIGFDFDNTIVCYDEAIAVLAEQMFELPPQVPRTKLGLRGHLRSSGREPEWTAFQGALYGPGMVHAKPYEGAVETMQALVKQGHQLTIVSHRSCKPYAGPPFDLHTAARGWVAQRLQTAGLFLDIAEHPEYRSTVNFLETRKAKVAMIAELCCQVFVDDLPEVLDDPGFPKATVGVHFTPSGEGDCLPNHHRISAWRQLPQFLARFS